MFKKTHSITLFWFAKLVFRMLLENLTPTVLHEYPLQNGSYFKLNANTVIQRRV